MVDAESVQWQCDNTVARSNIEDEVTHRIGTCAGVSILACAVTQWRKGGRKEGRKEERKERFIWQYDKYTIIIYLAQGYTKPLARQAPETIIQNV